MKIKKILTTLIFLLLISNVFGATLQGKVFEWYTLEELNNVIIEVNSEPVQRIVSTNGQYSFELNQGNYLLTAEFFENGELVYFSKENIKIEQEGIYNLDIIMLPSLTQDLNELEGLTDFDDIESTNVEEIFIPETNFLLLGAILLVLIAIIGAYYWKNKQQINKEKILKTEEEPIDSQKQEIITAITELGKRTTQKELRNKIPSMSEAKISLILTELEDEDKIKKIKKGRGNIIILK